MRSKVWVSFSWITFQPLHEEIAKFYCTASSFHKIFNLVHNEVHNEVNLRNSKSCKVHKILRHTTFSWTCCEEQGLCEPKNLIFSALTKSNFVCYFFATKITFKFGLFQKKNCKYVNSIYYMMKAEVCDFFKKK